MKLAFFDTHRFERAAFEAANARFGQAITWLEPRLTQPTAVLAGGHEAVCAFVNDRLDAGVLRTLHAGRRAAGRPAVGRVQPTSIWKWPPGSGSPSRACRSIRRTRWRSTPWAWR